MDAMTYDAPKPALNPRRPGAIPGPNAPERRRPLYPGTVPEFDINGPVVQAVKAWIVERRGSHRPPIIAARVLAMMVELHAKDLPFPDRALLAEMLDTTKDSIDAAKNAALYNNEVTQEIRTMPSDNLDNTKRTWMTRWTYYVPGPDLIAVVRDAKRKASLKAAREAARETARRRTA